MVSRKTIYTPEGQRICSRCQHQPARPGQVWCRECHTDYCRQRRAGMVQVLLTPGEWEDVKAARKARSPGRHAAQEAT